MSKRNDGGHLDKPKRNKEEILLRTMSYKYYSIFNKYMTSYLKRDTKGERER